MRKFHGMSDMQKQEIYHFMMPSQYWLTSTFLRFQEYYESPKFQGQSFSLEEFQDWYVTTRQHHGFSYYTDWSGFNFPSRVTDSFLDVFKDASRKEEWLLDQIYSLTTGKFYVIGTYQDSKRDSVIQHEVVHALFYLHEDYAKSVTDLIQGFEFATFKRVLIDMGYVENVLIDEINAYVTTGLCKQLKGADITDVKACRSKLLKMFRKRFGFNIADKKISTDRINDLIHHVDCSTIAPQNNE